jgi:ABC-2 type transport system permease protein
MSPASQVAVLARREFLQRAKSRAFQITMLVTVGLVLSIGPLLAFAIEDPDPAVVAVTPDAPPGIVDALEQQAARLEVAVRAEPMDSLQAAETALREGRVDAVLAGSELVWLEEESLRVRAVVTGAVATTALRQAAAELGISEQELATLLAGQPLDDRVLVQPDPEEEPRRIGAFVGLMLLYMSILIFGQFVAMGIMEEKQNRVVEVVLSRVRPTQVLVSKVLGIGALGLVQLIVLGLAIWFAATLIEVEDVSLPTLGAEILAGVVFWFILGYALYSVGYAALGATVSRQEDLQGTLMIPVVLLIPGFVFAQIAAEDPDNTVAVVASFVPLWSPMVMPSRAAVGDVVLWELALSVALIVVTAYILIRIGGRIYSGAILRLGAKVKLRDAWSSAHR